jgi:hypothetical protein
MDHVRKETLQNDRCGVTARQLGQLGNWRNMESLWYFFYYLFAAL